MVFQPQLIVASINILFSDAFAEGFAQLGNVAACTELHGGKAANNQLFWEGIQEAFSGQDEAHDNLHFADDEVLEAVHDIDFKKIVPHDWKKLQALWKRLNAAYKAALSGFTMSGTHSSNFFEFCGDHHEIYYLHKHLEFRPDLVATVVADLPEEVFLESDDKPASRISSVSKHKRDQDSVIVEALHELRTSRMEAEMSQQKLTLMQHQDELLVKEEERRQKEEEREKQEEARTATEHLFKHQEEARKATEHHFRHQEEVRKAKDHLFKQQEEARKAREHVFNEWEHTQLHLRELSKALGTETNNMLKREMEADIVALINRKNQLFAKLN